MDGTIGEIRMFGGNFPPLNWQYCQGQLLAISDYEALYTLIGTTYGGDGINTFGLPNLSSRVAIGTGQGPGLSNYVLGQMAGTEANTLTANNIGMHSHPISGTAALPVSSEDGHNVSPVGNFPAVNGDKIYATTSDGSLMASAQISLVANPAGSLSPLPIDNIKPYIGINYIICLLGIFPTRN